MVCLFLVPKPNNDHTQINKDLYGSFFVGSHQTNGYPAPKREAPNSQVEIIKGFAKKNFKSTPVLDYALAVAPLARSLVQVLSG